MRVFRPFDEGGLGPGVAATSPRGRTQARQARSTKTPGGTAGSPTDSADVAIGLVACEPPDAPPGTTTLHPSWGVVTEITSGRRSDGVRESSRTTLPSRHDALVVGELSGRDDRRVLPPVGGRRHARRSLEEPAEEGRVLVAHREADVVDPTASRLEEQARALDPQGVHVVDRPVAGRRLEAARERPPGQAGPLGHRGHRVRGRVVVRDPGQAVADHRVVGPDAPRHRGERQLPVLVAGEQVDLGGPRSRAPGRRTWRSGGGPGPART